MKKIAALFLSAVMVLSLGACQSKTTEASSNTDSTASTANEQSAETATLDTIKADGYITLATNAEFEPFEFKDGDGYMGIDIEISKKIAEKLGVELQVHDIAFDTVIAEVQSGKANFAAAGITVNEDRKKNVDFSETYFNANQSVIVLADSEIKVPADLSGKKVGVQQGTTGDVYCTNEDGTSEVTNIEVQRYNKGVDAVTDLINGRLDAVVIDDFPATKFVEKNSDKIQKLSDTLTVEEYAIAVKKGDTAMLQVINEVLKEMKDSGELQTVIDSYENVLVG
ncbi:transporter substrate-binding domain-containing protein [Scatolibacter rhodanostii]|uniref:transporter substrate-binding domain-containing protein n=1 Tax=Scatolibacter rhodanostii TaxID=2014781 RepID=UPI000C08B808